MHNCVSSKSHHEKACNGVNETCQKNIKEKNQNNFVEQLNFSLKKTCLEKGNNFRLIIFCTFPPFLAVNWMLC